MHSIHPQADWVTTPDRHDAEVFDFALRVCSVVANDQRRCAEAAWQLQQREATQGSRLRLRLTILRDSAHHFQ